MYNRKKAISLAVLLVFMPLLAGCPKGTLTHKVTAAQHNFRFAVGAFQDAEIAEHDKGFVPNDLHVQMQTGIQKVALAGKDLDNALAAGADSATIKAKLDNIYTLLDSLNSDGILGVKNPTSKATLEIALDSIKAIIDNALVLVS